MKKLIFSIIGIITLMLSSCGDKTTANLFNSVPKNTKFLTVVNPAQIFEKAGAGAATSKSDLAKLLDTQTTQRGEKSKDEWSFILGNAQTKDESKEIIDPESLILVYEYKNATLVTFLVKDEKAFREGIEEKTGDKLSEGKDKLWISAKHKIFTKGKQAWLTSGYPALNDDDIKILTSLKEEESILSLDKGKEMAENKADIAFLYELKDLMQFGVLNSNVTMGLNLAYDDPSYLSGYMNFNVGKAEGEIKVLNNKFQPAKRALAPGKIDTNLLSKFPGKGNIFFATNISSNIITTVLGKLKNVMLPFEIKDALQKVNGTIIASLNNTLDEEGTMQPSSGTIAISMADDASADSVAASLEEYGKEMFEADVRADGNILLIDWGEPSGTPMASVANNFENCNLGVVVLSDALSGESNAPVRSLIKEVALGLADQGESSVIKIRIDTKEGTSAFNSLFEAGSFALNLNKLWK